MPNKDQKPEQPEPRGPSPSDDALESLLRSVDAFLSEISSQAVSVAPEGELRVLLASTGQSLTEQNRRLSAHIRDSAKRLSAPQRTEIAAFLAVQDGPGLAQRGLETSQRLLGDGLVKRLIRWLAQHFQELKKILKEVLKLIFDLLGIKWPDWLDRILQILDEVLNLLLSLLGEVFGIDFGLTARQLSEGEVNYLREMAAFETLRVAQLGNGLRPDET